MVIPLLGLSIFRQTPTALFITFRLHLQIRKVRYGVETLPQTIKHLQKERFSDEILAFYQKVKNSITPENSENPDETRNRFEDNFLLFCEKKLKKEKYNSIRDPKKLLKTIWEKYRRKESRSKFLLSKFFKTLSFIIAVIPSIIVTCVEYFVNEQLDWSLLIWFIASLIVAIVIEIILHVITPNCFCTFEKMEFEGIYKKRTK